jgi:hypothetical protein
VLTSRLGNIASSKSSRSVLNNVGSEDAIFGQFGSETNSSETHVFTVTVEGVVTVLVTVPVLRIVSIYDKL